MTWLIVGGAGYIGSHLVDLWSRENLPFVVLDNLSTGLRESLPKECNFVNGDAADIKLVSKIIRQYKISGIIHLAAYKNARESLQNPYKYWSNNINGTLGLLSAIYNFPIKNFILSSSCSIYGTVNKVVDKTKYNPLSPYARSKLAVEWMVKDFCNNQKINQVSLRYFNVIGNSNFPFAIDRDKKSLIPSISLNIKQNIIPKIYGNKFNTQDGTAVRDYIDVRDLAKAHLLVALNLDKKIDSRIESRDINVSTGIPVSVLDVIKIIVAESNWQKGMEIYPEIEGEPASVWALPDEYLINLNWKNEYTLQDSIKSYLNHPDLKLFL